MHRLPKVVRAFPGWTIKIKQVPQSFFAPYKNTEHETIEGLWDVDQLTIYVCKTLNKKAKFLVYYHELIHAANDWHGKFTG